MFKVALRNILRRRLRSSLTAAGIAVAVAVLLLIDQVASSYREQLLQELNGMGVHLMLVPLGCPYDAAARVLKGNTLETSLPEEALFAARRVSEVEIAAPLLIAALPRPEQGRTDMFVGLDESGITLKSWWKAERGMDRFPGDDAIILGAEAARMEMREPGDQLHSPETGRKFEVAGVLQRSGTSDDNLFFVPLRTAQKMFDSSNRLTAVAIRLRDPAALSDVSARLQDIAGAQVVTQTEMMGTFLNILGNVRTLLQSIGWVALFASLAGLANTLLISVAERTAEFSLMRAIGASRAQVMSVILLESMLLTAAGILLGLAVTLTVGGLATPLFAAYLPFFGSLSPAFRPGALGLVLLTGIAGALLASLMPGLRAVATEPAFALKGGE
jgi:putative ABC transport system permease protein